jgi:hypothetical protein
MSKTTITEKHVKEHLLGKVGELRASNKDNVDKRVALATARDLLIVDELQKSLAKIFKKGWVSPPKYSSKKRSKPHNRIVNLILSDLHFGSHLNSEECPFEYNTVQESRRLGRVIQQTAEYKMQYRDESRLVLHLLGDVIQNQLHDLRDGEPLSIQFATAVHYLTQAIIFLCSQYPQVEVYCATGNHGRNTARHPEKAVNQKFDSIETMIYVAIKTAVLNAGITSCEIHIPKSPYYTVQLFDSKLFGTHGDTLLRPGNPGRSINVAGLYSQICTFNTARKIGGPFNVFIMGHIHVGSVINLPGNVTVITNGALTPPDNFSLSVGYPDNTCGQWIWESVPGHAIGDQRFVVVDEAENKPKYNNIIKTFTGF